jgi:hypothetical protein
VSGTRYVLFESAARCVAQEEICVRIVFAACDAGIEEPSARVWVECEHPLVVVQHGVCVLEDGVHVDIELCTTYPLIPLCGYCGDNRIEQLTLCHWCALAHKEKN